MAKLASQNLFSLSSLINAASTMAQLSDDWLMEIDILSSIFMDQLKRTEVDFANFLGFHPKILSCSPLSPLTTSFLFIFDVIYALQSHRPHFNSMD